MYIKEKTTLEAWKKALRIVKNKGNDIVDDDKRVYREILNLYIEIKSPKEDVTKPIETLQNFKQWFYPPLSEISSMMLKKKAPLYSYATGPRLFSFQDQFNQIDDFIIPLLKQNLSSKRAVVTFWDPLKDGNIDNKDIPSMVTIDLKVKDKKLNLTAMIRSSDLFFGWPANIYQIYSLQKHVADKLNLEGGSIGVFATSAHIFQDMFDTVDIVLKNKI